MYIFVLFKSTTTNKEIRSDGIIRVANVEGTAEFELWLFRTAVV